MPTTVLSASTTTIYKAAFTWAGARDAATGDSADYSPPTTGEIDNASGADPVYTVYRTILIYQWNRALGTPDSAIMWFYQQSVNPNGGAVNVLPFSPVIDPVLGIVTGVSDYSRMTDSAIATANVNSTTPVSVSLSSPTLVDVTIPDIGVLTYICYALRSTADIDNSPPVIVPPTNTQDQTTAYKITFDFGDGAWFPLVVTYGSGGGGFGSGEPRRTVIDVGKRNISIIGESARKTLIPVQERMTTFHVPARKTEFHVNARESIIHVESKM